MTEIAGLGDGGHLLSLKTLLYFKMLLKSLAKHGITVIPL